MDERYLTSFEDQTAALGYTSGDTTLVSPQVSLIGADEIVYSKEIPHESRIKFAKDEATGKLYFIVDGVYYDVTELVKKSRIPVPSEGYKGVDLGLIWADRNVGAENPWDYGAYFSWGNVEGVVSNGTKKISEDDLIRIILIEEDGVPTDEITQEMIDNTKLELGENLKEILSGYWLISEYSFDQDTYANTLGGQYTGSTLDAEHDAATVNMGNEWRMPTSAEILDLVKNTKHYYIGLNGEIVAGPFDYTTNSSDKGLDGSNLRSICFVKQDATFNYNDRSNFIEFPFAGYCNGSLLGLNGLYGFVWSSSVYEGGTENARYLDFISDGYLDGVYNNYRYNGLSVRGVRA